MIVLLLRNSKNWMKNKLIYGKGAGRKNTTKDDSHVRKRDETGGNDSHFVEKRIAVGVVLWYS